MANLISVTYESVDNWRESRCYKTLDGAKTFAQKMVGKTPEIGSYYAVSRDGIGKVMVSGASLKDLFPRIFGTEDRPAAPKVSYYRIERLGEAPEQPVYAVWYGSNAQLAIYATRAEAEQHIAECEAEDKEYARSEMAAP